MTLTDEDVALLKALYRAETLMLDAFAAMQTACATYGTARVVLGPKSATTRKALISAKQAHAADQAATHEWAVLHRQAQARGLPGTYTGLSGAERDAIRASVLSTAA